MLVSRCVSTSQRYMKVTISKLWIARVVMSSSHDEALGFGHFCWHTFNVSCRVLRRYGAVNVATLWSLREAPNLTQQTGHSMQVLLVYFNPYCHRSDIHVVKYLSKSVRRDIAAIGIAVPMARDRILQRALLDAGLYLDGI